MEDSQKNDLQASEGRSKKELSVFSRVIALVYWDKMVLYQSRSPKRDSARNKMIIQVSENF